MNILVVDTSVVAQWYLWEEYSPIAIRLIDDRYELHAPQLMLLELDNVLCRHVRQDKIDESHAHTIRKTVREVDIRFHHDIPLLDSAFALTTLSRCSMYDAVFLSLAQLINGRMITADRRLVRNIQPGPWSKHLVWIGEFAE